VLRFGQWALRRSAWVRIALDPVYFVANLLVHIAWGIEISRRASIGPGLYIGHFGGITVSGSAVIGSNCNLSQNITVGLSGDGVPVIGDDVYIAPGARIFGRIRIGNNVKIGANAVIHKDIPDNAVVALAPGYQIISYAGNRRRPTSV
jgi:serine O-acetyltransferase